MNVDIIIQYAILAGMLLTLYKVFFKQGEGSKLADEKQKGAIDLLKEQLGSSQKMNLKLIDENKNHIHTLDQGLKENRNVMNNISIELGKLATIIDERIPKK